jgi:myosin-1
LALFSLQAVTKRAHRKKEPAGKGTSRRDRDSGGKPQVKKAVFETTKKKEVGVSDLTLISKISNEAINDNLKKRFENREIYVCHPPSLDSRARAHSEGESFLLI